MELQRAATMLCTSMMLKRTMEGLGCRLSTRRWSHFTLPAPLERVIDCKIETLSILPKFDEESDRNLEIKVPNFPFSGSMELMAVPKKKVSPHKRGIRNGPKALKPVPVIIRCKSCGRVKLPHFYCCSGDRGTASEQNDSSSR